MFQVWGEVTDWDVVEVVRARAHVDGEVVG